MGKLTFSMMASLDGYVCDTSGDFSWGQIDEEVHRFANAEQARHHVQVYGRRMYETMRYWEIEEARPDPMAEFARLWRQSDKVVVSRSLAGVNTANTRLVRSLNVDEMRRLKAEAGSDIAIAGPTVAAPFLAAGLVDEVGIYFIPVVIGGGTPMFINVERRIDLERIEQRGFGNSVTYVRFRVRQRVPAEG